MLADESLFDDAWTEVVPGRWELAVGLQADWASHKVSAYSPAHSGVSFEAHAACWLSSPDDGWKFQVVIDGHEHEPYHRVTLELAKRDCALGIVTEVQAVMKEKHPKT